MPRLQRETRHPHSGDAVIHHWRRKISCRDAHLSHPHMHLSREMPHFPRRMRWHLQNLEYVTLLYHLRWFPHEIRNSLYSLEILLHSTSNDSNLQLTHEMISIYSNKLSPYLFLRNRIIYRKEKNGRK
jgi:hypothetical protein